MPDPAPQLRITVNGEPATAPAGTTVAELLGRLGLGEGPVAVERNRSIVKKADHPTVALAEGDQLEIVTFLGGG